MRAEAVWAVVVNYNGLPQVLDCLGSLQGQTMPPGRIVVVDNASRDGSPQAIKERFPQATLLAAPHNGGFAQGANLGLQAALDQGAEAVWLLNPDAVARPRALAALLRALEDDPQAGAAASVLLWAGGGRVQAWGGGNVSLLTGRSRHLSAPPSGQGPDYLCGGSLLLRAEALARVGLLDPGFPLYWEDADLSWRLRRAGWRLAVAPESLVEHQHAAALGDNERAWHRLYTYGSSRFFAKHAPLPWLPLGLSAGARLVRRALQGRPQAALGIWDGLFSHGRKELPS
ncbi:MAG: glycosyltransferase family 2 protein [Desulfarculaceae bacterium]|nr:glycosyltransferase family 2 protein [Desulfarculaceae bacterium]